MIRSLVGVAAATALLAAPSAAKLPVDSPLHPAFNAVFSQTSYAPSSIATLRVVTPVKNLDLQILRAGAERAWSSVGRPWGPDQHITFRRVGVNLVRVRLGAWTSGLYFARLTTSVGKTAYYAPFVLRPVAWGTSRVAVVLPTYSWQAYNFFDVKRDGTSVRPSKSERTRRKYRAAAGASPVESMCLARSSHDA